MVDNIYCGVNMFLLVVSLVVFLIGQSDGIEAKNGTIIRYATYHVDQMYQACPPAGKTVVDKWVGGSTKDLEKRLSKLEKQTEELNEKNKYLLKEVEKLKDVRNEDDTCKVTEAIILSYKAATQTVKKVDGSLPKDCAEIHGRGLRISGVYWIKPHGSSRPVQALCDLTMVEGWTVIMHRFNGSVVFYRKWADYKNGFGFVSGEHWLGNDNIYHLTNQKKYKLRMEFTYWTGGHSYSADYASFRIDSEASKYQLHVSGYSGNSGHDRLTYHNGMYFSTHDKDNDKLSGNCAVKYKSGFWYNKCYSINPTGLYKSSGGDIMYYNKPTKTMVLKIAPNI